MSRWISLVKTEPALFTNAVQAVIGIVAAFGIGFTPDQVAGFLAATAAVLTAVTAAATRPVQVSAFTGLVTATGVLVAAYGIHLNTGIVGSVNFLLTALFGLLTRAQVTPVASLRKPPPAAPSIIPPATQKL